MTTLPIILDTNEYIFGLTKKERSCEILLRRILGYRVIAPRIILDELHKNLGAELLNRLYVLIVSAGIEIVDKKAPIGLIEKYSKDLPYEDSIIAAHCEMSNVKYLVSENRHFLVGFNPNIFKVISAKDFLKIKRK